MWRHFPHHSHAICGEISDFYTSVTRRNLKLLHMWRKFRFLHICHVERFEITLHVEKFQKSPHLSCIEIWNFSTWQFFSPQIYWWDWWQISGMHTGCIFFWLFSTMCLQKTPQKECITLAALFWLFSAVFIFHMSPHCFSRSGWKVTLVTFVWLCFLLHCQSGGMKALASFHFQIIANQL